jgi:hypothetical protein
MSKRTVLSALVALLALAWHLYAKMSVSAARAQNLLVNV